MKQQKNKKGRSAKILPWLFITLLFVSCGEVGDIKIIEPSPEPPKEPVPVAPAFYNYVKIVSNEGAIVYNFDDNWWEMNLGIDTPVQIVWEFPFYCAQNRTFWNGIDILLLPGKSKDPNDPNTLDLLKEQLFLFSFDLVKKEGKNDILIVTLDSNSGDFGDETFTFFTRFELDSADDPDLCLPDGLDKISETNVFAAQLS